MLSLVGKMFVPVVARPQLEQKCHTPSNTAHVQLKTAEEARKAQIKPSNKVVALYRGARRRLGLNSSKKEENSICIAPLPGSDTSLITTEFAKSTGRASTDQVNPSLANDVDQDRGDPTAECNDATETITQQGPSHVLAPTPKAATAVRVKPLSKDSGYASDDKQSTSGAPGTHKKGKLRRIGQRLSAKCKSLLHGSSKASRDAETHQERSKDSIEATKDNITNENDDGDDDGPDDIGEQLNKEDAEEKDEEEEQEEEEEEDDGSHRRCDFKAIETISDEKLQELVSFHCALDDATCDVRVERRTKGAYNFAAILTLTVDHVRKGYVVRIPGHATHVHWKVEDEYMMDREVQLIEHIRARTTAPVPEVIHHSTKHDNLIGFPYILMTQLPGKDAFSIWHDGDDYDSDDKELLFQHADNPSTATKAKRITFLRSLARIMTEIQTLSFDKIGMPIFAEGEAPTIGPIYQWNCDGSDFAHKRGPFTSAQNYAVAGLMQQSVCWNHSVSEIKSGALEFFHQVFTQAPFSPAGPETFTVYHRDLDLQNILVDEDGNVTGIIDWDKAFVAPRFVGTAAAPLFLQKDWLPDYLNNLENGPHMGWKTHYYREVYAAALVEAGNSDAIYTTKSAIYRSAFMAICDVDGGAKMDLMDKVLREIPHCRLKSPEFARGLGLGWKDAEAMLKVELAKVLKPELPPPNLLEGLDAEMALKTWYLDFNVEDDEEEEEADEESDDEDENTDAEDEDTDEESASGSDCDEVGDE